MAIKIALAGNPNCGKTTLFNALTGSSQYVGNWPGVTVEKKEGKLKGNPEVIIQDLPGIYSLSPYTLEEVVARTYLVTEKPDAILNIVDGTNIERNLYLSTQLIELGIPVVIAVNMMDLVRKNGDQISTKELARQLGCAVVEISALKNEGSLEAANKAVEAARAGRKGQQPAVSASSYTASAAQFLQMRFLVEVPQSRLFLSFADSKSSSSMSLPDSGAGISLMYPQKGHVSFLVSGSYSIVAAQLGHFLSVMSIVVSCLMFSSPVLIWMSFTSDI